MKNKVLEQIEYEDVDGFGIEFERFPGGTNFSLSDILTLPPTLETTLKKRSEIALIHSIDLIEVETKDLDVS